MLVAACSNLPALQLVVLPYHVCNLSFAFIFHTAQQVMTSVAMVIPWHLLLLLKQQAADDCNVTIVQCAGAAIASIILKGLDSTGYKAAAGASNQINTDAGATIGRALGFEIVLTYVSGSSASAA